LKILIPCDWPGYKCGLEAEFFYRNRTTPQYPNEGPVKQYVARCEHHQPTTKRTGGLPVTMYDRISREDFVVWQVMES
jgi:hypothetical protein